MKRVAVVPSFGTDSSAMRPPACSTRVLQTNKPMPRPFPGGFVVNDSSKAFARTSGFIPRPQSRTDTATPSPAMRVLMPILRRPASPMCSMASAALSSRFIRIWVT